MSEHRGSINTKFKRTTGRLCIIFYFIWLFIKHCSVNNELIHIINLATWDEQYLRRKTESSDIETRRMLAHLISISVTDVRKKSHSHCNIFHGKANVGVSNVGVANVGVSNFQSWLVLVTNGHGFVKEWPNQGRHLSDIRMILIMKRNLWCLVYSQYIN